MTWHEGYHTGQMNSAADVYLGHDVCECLCAMSKCLSDPGKAGFTDAAAQVVGGQQGVHDVQKLHREASAGLRYDWLAVWGLLVAHWAVHVHHFFCEVLTQQQAVFLHLQDFWLFHCTMSKAACYK